MANPEQLITEDDYVRAADRLQCDVAAIKAVTEVESRGGGFDPEGFPKTLFEGHWFHKLTKGLYSSSSPTLSYPKWTRQFYGKSWQAEKQRLNAAAALDRDTALMSASWGMFQVMGFNHRACGYDTIQQFVNAMCLSEGKQLDAFVSFVLTNGLDGYLRDLNWADFANRYNGPGYRENRYDTKLQVAYAKYQQTND